MKYRWGFFRLIGILLFVIFFIYGLEPVFTVPNDDVYAPFFEPGDSNSQRTFAMTEKFCGKICFCVI